MREYIGTSVNSHHMRGTTLPSSTSLGEDLIHMSVIAHHESRKGQVPRTVPSTR